MPQKKETFVARPKKKRGRPAKNPQSEHSAYTGLLGTYLDSGSANGLKAMFTVLGPPEIIVRWPGAGQASIKARSARTQV